jgi:hypothetical protein
MTRVELVAAAKAAGIAKANNTKSEVLVQMLAELNAPKTTGKRGRPVDTNSVRQVRLAELEAKRANGELRRGRPVETDSARQIRLAELEAKKASGGFKLGRPVDTSSARQVRLAELEAKRASGELRRGRPAKVKTEETVS